MLNNIRRVLLVKKTSRFAYEKKRTSCQNDEAFAQKLAEQGSEYQGLLQRHLNHERNTEELYNCLTRREVSVAIRDQDTNNTVCTDQSDIVIAAGGDGNFLAAASWVTRHDHMLVGINTDPERSEGHLCITPTPTYPICRIVDDIFDNRLKTIRRQRIRVKLNGRSLPVLGLNEVFIGDSDPSQACYFEVSCDNESPDKIRSSGLLVYTGTGSTSWAYNTRKLYTMDASCVLRLAREKLNSDVSDFKLEEIAEDVTKLFNNQIMYSGDDTKMGCVIREPIKRGSTNGLLVNPSRYCSRLIKVKSRSFDNQLIIDGHKRNRYPFTNGMEAEFSINPQDSLLTLTDVDR